MGQLSRAPLGPADKMRLYELPSHIQDTTKPSTEGQKEDMKYILALHANSFNAPYQDQGTAMATLASQASKACSCLPHRSATRLLKLEVFVGGAQFVPAWKVKTGTLATASNPSDSRYRCATTSPCNRPGNHLPLRLGSDSLLLPGLGSQ